LARSVKTRFLARAITRRGASFRLSPFFRFAAWALSARADAFVFASPFLSFSE
jgi:hypothetical protein